MFNQAIAQDPFIKDGQIRAKAAISPGIVLNYPLKPVYIEGDLEYYLNEHVSVRGTGYYNVSDNDLFSMFKYNHSLFAGLSYHFTRERKFDPFVSFEPGFAFSKVEGINLENDKRLNSVDPLISGNAGINFYATKYFHLTAEARYIHGKHRSYYLNMPMNEFRFSFGLGFNIHVKKKRNTLTTEPQFKG